MGSPQTETGAGEARLTQGSGSHLLAMPHSFKERESENIVGNQESIKEMSSQGSRKFLSQTTSAPKRDAQVPSTRPHSPWRAGTEHEIEDLYPLGAWLHQPPNRGKLCHFPPGIHGPTDYQSFLQQTWSVFHIPGTGLGFWRHRNE